MNGRILNMDIPVHQAVQELLPWYVTSQLAPEETRRVQEHLQTCAQCRQELEWERGIRAEAAASRTDSGTDSGTMSADLPEGVDMERALARLLPALGPQAADKADAPVPLPWWRKAAANQPTWLRWTVAAQWVLIAGLAALLLRPAEEPAVYRVLGSAVSAGGNMVVVFQPNTSEHELRRILQAQNARVVDGPTMTDAYLLNVPAANRNTALQALRTEPAVKLVEALDGGSPP